MKQITEHIFYMDAVGESDQPFVYFIRGSRFCLQIDAGNSRSSYNRFLHELNQLHLPQPDLLVLTHWHWDHSFGLCAAACPSISSPETRKKLEEVQTWEWSEEAMKKRLLTGEDIDFTYDCIRREYPDLSDIHVALPSITFEHEMTIRLGEVTCHLEHRDSPHTRDAVFIHVPEDEVLIGGDAQYEDYYDNDSQYDPRRLSAFISYLKGMPFKTYLKGHDEPAISRKDLIAKMEGYLAEIS